MPGHNPPQPEQVEVSLQERERELETQARAAGCSRGRAAESELSCQVEALRKDTGNLEQRTFLRSVVQKGLAP